MLKFLALSGTTDVTENLYVYELDNDMIVVDYGVGFPDSDMYGVDLVIPDFEYIVRNKNELRAIIITHGHEDHLGAIPFLLQKVKAPIYSTKLVSGFIEEKLHDYGMEYKVNVFNPDSDELTFGQFKIIPFRTSHSVPDSVGFCIDTPAGKAFHVPDYKFDWTPVDGKPFDVAKLAKLASDGALMLASDSLGATSPGYTESEITIEERIKVIAEKNTQGAIFFTTISSNISRMQQAINVAQSLGRKVVFVGRSVEKKALIAEKFGYLKYPHKAVISKREAKRFPPGRLLYIISGCYGQPGSNLYRVALGEHDRIEIAEGDTVIFSADPAPPGTKTNVDMVVDKLIEGNIEVHYYDMQEDLHVSGHGSMEDIKMLFALVNPKFFIPIGGTVRHMRAYKDIAVKMGNKGGTIFELGAGEVVEFEDGLARRGQKIKVKSVLVDGLGVGDVGKTVLRDRQLLATDGVVIVMLQLDKNEESLVKDPELISRGFVFQGKNQAVLDEGSRYLYGEISKRKKVGRQFLRNLSIDLLEKYFYEKTGRRPMILPVVVEI